MALETLRPNEALEYNDDALQRAPRRIDVLCQRSHILLAKNQPDEALAVAQRALEIDRQALPVLVALAQANHALQHLAEAQGFYQQILLIDAHHEAALIGMRDIALQQGEITAAADAAQRLVSLHPKSAHHHLRLGEVLVALGVPEAALIELQQAIALERMPASTKNAGGSQLASQAYARMSAAYAKSARWSEARECAEEAVKRTPDVAEHHALARRCTPRARTTGGSGRQLPTGRALSTTERAVAVPPRVSAPSNWLRQRGDTGFATGSSTDRSCRLLPSAWSGSFGCR